MTETIKESSRSTVDTTARRKRRRASLYRVAVTGDNGLDVYTRYMPGCLSEDAEKPGHTNRATFGRADEQFYPSIAFDLEPIREPLLLSA